MHNFDLTNFRITMDTSKLLEILKTNREIHESDYKKARAAFEERAIKALQDRLEKFQSDKSGKGKADMNFYMEVPKNHVKAYNEALKMLGHHTETTFELNSESYRSLVENQWNWSHSFYTTASFYCPELSKDFLENG